LSVIVGDGQSLAMMRIPDWKLHFSVDLRDHAVAWDIIR
jgi:hypothetical protein